ncbi:MAG TPA: hypothetical protein VM325_16715 [Alphaproteobacteria bacterium]|nr:hypothetical protein [Alphaproteobacteria bacterium]
METLRTIIAAAVALSLVVLPVSAAEMRSSMAAGMTDTAAHADCCPQSGHCEKQTKKGCGDSGACFLKCTVLPAAQTAAMDLATPPKASPNLATLVENTRSTLDHPALPPPRV